MNECFLCKSSKKDDIQYGEFLKKEHFGVHTYCLYLSSNLAQNGGDDEGFLGFLEADIRQEVRRISLLKCCYCYKKYANIGCCEPKCRHAFHLICGIENNAENRFSHDFRSYCHRHGRKVKERPSPNETCLICFENLCAPGKRFHKATMIISPCCRNGWFHKLCLQKFAINAGYFFKCPLCNDSKVFREKLPAKGIYIPNRDAAWELEPNAFAELLERPNECIAPKCKNKRGRKASSNNNPFIMCVTCGSVAIHKQCFQNNGKSFYCADCIVALQENDSGRESLNSHVNQNCDEYIDVCNVSDKEDIDLINMIIAADSNIENRKDSDMQNKVDSIDEEIPHETSNSNKIRRKFESSEEDLSSDSNSEHIKPCSTKRFRIESLSSDSQLESDENSVGKIKPCILKHKRRLRMESSSSSSHTNVRLVEDINLCNIKQKRRLRIDSESSESSVENIKPCCIKQKRSLKIDSDSQQESKIASETAYNNKKIPSRRRPNKRRTSGKSENCITNESKEFRKEQSVKFKSLTNESLESQSSNPDLTNTSAKKSQGLNIVSDSEDRIEVGVQKHLDCEGKVQVSQSLSITTYDSSDDTDPLDDFSYFLENHKSNKGNKTIRFAGLRFSKDSVKREQTLDISCIAKRTRRKSYCSSSKNIKKEQKEKENPLNVSYVAARTRRKTICAETDYGKQKQQEMSPIYEKLYTSIDYISSSTENDSEQNLNNELQDSKFNISCIANRTRKRKSLKSKKLALPKIDEISECNPDSSISLDLSKNNTHSSCSNLHLNSYYCAEFQTSTSALAKETKLENIKTKAVPSNLLIEKYPLQNCTAFLGSNNNTKSSNTNSIYNYHPADSYSPHSNNRNRV